MSDLTKQQFDKWLHEIVAESTDGQRIQRRDCMTVDQECMAFEVWKASRECLVIDLPEKARITDPSDMLFIGSNGAINKCRDAIHAAGVKTK